MWIAPLPILVTTVCSASTSTRRRDRKKGVRTLPVILGESRARLVARALMIAFYPIVVGAALVGWIGPWVALVLLGLPRLVEVLRTFSKPRPESPPHSYVGWPSGSSAARSSTRGGPAGCSCSASCSTRCCHLPWV